MTPRPGARITGRDPPDKYIFYANRRLLVLWATAMFVGGILRSAVGDVAGGIVASGMMILSVTCILTAVFHSDMGGRVRLGTLSFTRREDGEAQNGGHERAEPLRAQRAHARRR